MNIVNLWNKIIFKEPFVKIIILRLRDWKGKDMEVLQDMG
jgi:hypothetical protein